MAKIPSLRPGDRVAITAPASKVNVEDLSAGIAKLEAWGLKIEIGSTVGVSHFNFSARREQRRDELQKFLDDPEIRLIITARGGYGSSDLLDQLDFREFSKYPKWLVGFSDITAIILHLNKLGYPAIHGPMVKTFEWDAFSGYYLKDLLFGKTTDYFWDTADFNRHGVGAGLAVGGNLALLAHSIGSSSDFSFDNTILFLEDVGEKVYNVDRMMVQLKRAGKFDNLAALVIGDFTDMSENDTPFGKTVHEIVLDHVSDKDYPVVFNMPFGHDEVNWPVMMGARYSLIASERETNLKLLDYESV